MISTLSFLLISCLLAGWFFVFPPFYPAFSFHGAFSGTGDPAPAAMVLSFTSKNCVSSFYYKLQLKASIRLSGFWEVFLSGHIFAPGKGWRYTGGKSGNHLIQIPLDPSGCFLARSFKYEKAPVPIIGADKREGFQINRSPQIRHAQVLFHSALLYRKSLFFSNGALFFQIFSLFVDLFLQKIPKYI